MRISANGSGRNDVRIAREEVFGPVLVVIPSDTDEGAIGITNDSMRKRGDATPFIVITAFPDDGVRASALKAGATCFLAKPLAALELIACLGAALLQRGGVDAGLFGPPLTRRTTAIAPNCCNRATSLSACSCMLSSD